MSVSKTRSPSLAGVAGGYAPLSSGLLIPLAYIPANSPAAGLNLVTNGRFRTNQRAYASAASLASGAYGFDRWKATTASTTLTYSVVPQGQPVTINSGGSVAQVIERAEAPAGSYVLSWDGTATGRVYNVGGSPPSYAASPVLVTLDGTADVTVEFQASGATKTLDKVKFEAGSTPTTYVQGNVSTEQTQCQRFFQLISGWTGVAVDSATIEMSYQFPVTMRAAPTTAKVSGVVLNYRNSGGDTNIAAATWGIANPTSQPTALWLQLTGNSGLQSFRAYFSRGGVGPVISLTADL